VAPRELFQTVESAIVAERQWLEQPILAMVVDMNLLAVQELPLFDIASWVNQIPLFPLLFHQTKLPIQLRALIHGLAQLG
jgi:hypothetical protein